MPEDNDSNVVSLLPNDNDEPKGNSRFENISLVGIGSIITALSIIVGAVLTIESRYVRADEYHFAQASTELKIEEQAHQQRKWLLEDRIQDIEIKQPNVRTDIDNARLERYKRELGDTERAIRSIQKEQREIKRSR